MKILYLAPLIPDISGNGGKRAIYNHLDDLQRQGIEVKLLLFDVEDTGAQCPEQFLAFSPIVFPRALPRVGEGLRAKSRALKQLLAGRLPRSVAVLTSKQAKETFSGLATNSDSRFDLIVVDHLNAYGIAESMNFSQPLVYIAHNIESDVIRNQYEVAGKWSVERLVTRLEYFKMTRFERQLIDKANHIVLISSGDRDSVFLDHVQEKVRVWPELPPVRQRVWKYSASKSILFVGSAKYFPNKEAIHWMVEKLMPEIHRIEPTITLTIAGTAAVELRLPPAPDVVFAGFVSAERLEELHLGCDLFICPVTLGGGIKIKVLEASAYGMPIMATLESMRGIDYLWGISATLSKDPIADAHTIANCLSNSAKLEEMSFKTIEALDHARAIRKSLLETLELRKISTIS